MLTKTKNMNYHQYIQYIVKNKRIMKSKYEKLSKEAEKLKNCGKLNEAKLIYEKLTEAEPENIDNFFNLSAIYHELKDNVNELKYLSEVALRTNNEKYLFVCSLLSERIGNFELAIGYLNKILEFDPENLKAMYKIAILYGNIDKQLSCDMFIELYENNKNNSDFLYMAMLTSYEILKYKESAKFGLEYIKLFGENESAYVITGLSYLELYDTRNAEKYLKRAYEINPTDKNRINYVRACERNDKDELTLSLLGDIKNIEPAESKKLAEFLYMRINLKNKNHKDVGQIYFERNTIITNDDIVREKAKEMYFKLDVNERYNLSEEEFVQFRINLNKGNCEKERVLHSKLLRKEDFKNKKLLIYSSNGMGDLIMCIRYLPFMLEKTKDITLYVPKAIEKLLKSTYPELNIVCSDENVSFDEYDYTTTFMGLLYNLDIDLKNIPFPNGYLTADENSVKVKSDEEVIKNVKDKKIGIFWEGNAAILPNRSVKLNKLIPLFKNGRQIYSFQISKADEESFRLKKELSLIDLEPNIKNYEDTAAYLKNMDVLITIDSSIAHLAGALGVKTYLLLPHYTEWRWFYDTKTTPWYDSVRIFKQKEEGNWDEVIEKVNEALYDEFGI